MTKDKRLSDLLDSFDAKVAAAQQKRKEEQQAKESFIEKFEKHKATVIRPTLEELGAELERRGHRFEIREQAFRQERDGKTQEAAVSLQFSMSRGGTAFEESVRAVSRDQPHLSFSTLHYKNKVGIHESTLGAWGGGGYAGGVGEVTLEELTPDLIRDKFIALMAKIVGH